MSSNIKLEDNEKVRRSFLWYRNHWSTNYRSLIFECQIPERLEAKTIRTVQSRICYIAVPKIEDFLRLPAYEHD